MAYVAAEGFGLRIVDLTDPSNLVEVGSLDTTATDVFVSGGRAYITAEQKGLVIADLNISTLTLPQQIVVNIPDGNLDKAIRNRLGKYPDGGSR